MSSNAITPGLRILPADLPLPSPATGPASSPPTFGDLLADVVQHVDGQQAEAAGKIGDLLAGNAGDLSEALIAEEKADLSFQLMLQVRNKVVQAYQQIAGMQF